jgi:hypothetical protein
MKPLTKVAVYWMVAVVTILNASRAQELVPETRTAAEDEALAVAKDKAVLSPGQARISTKLDTILIPSIEFTYASLEEALSRVGLYSMDLDPAEPDPTKKGVNFVIFKPRVADGQPAPKPARVMLSMSDAPLRRILDEIATQSDTRYTIGESSVDFLPAADKDAAPEAKATTRIGPKAMENLKRLRTIVIPKIEFKDITLVEAVNFLNARVEELSQGAPMPLIKIGTHMSADARIKELRLRNIPLAEALLYCCEAVNDRFHIHDDGVQIGK